VAAKFCLTFLFAEIVGVASDVQFERT
jgi:hypothetical protein